MRRFLLRLLILSFVLISQISCFDSSEPDESIDSSCGPQEFPFLTGASGQSLVFNPDPIGASGNSSLVPTQLDLDQYVGSVNLERLTGRGVLEGQWVDVRTSDSCPEIYGAFSTANDFEYQKASTHFAETMAYYHGDQYRNFLEEAGTREFNDKVRVVAHCFLQDNAFFVRGKLSNGEPFQVVCLGDSIATGGATYANDAAVNIHEIQHGNNASLYSPIQELNQFWVDEAGSLNEGLADFMALLFLEPNTNASIDPRIFSRWALGTFFPGYDGSRGLHRCPKYDPDYPDCSNYELGANGFSSEQNRVSFSYPDGLGWDFGANYSGPGFVKSAFNQYTTKEEIHNHGLLIAGALWDAYQVIKPSYSTVQAAQLAFTQVIGEALKNLPKPSTTSISPITFMGFVDNIIQWAPVVGISQSDVNALKRSFQERGLYNAPQLPQNWAELANTTSYPNGIKILDHPSILINWAINIGANANLIDQGFNTGLNNSLDPGEVATLWFNIGNLSNTTAGGVELTLESLNSEIRLLPAPFNYGHISDSKAQIRYSKVNGSDIVGALSSSNPNYHIATDTNYFGTNPQFASNWRLALWIEVSENAVGGQSKDMRLTLKPSNGPVQVINFSIGVN